MSSNCTDLRNSAHFNVENRQHYVKTHVVPSGNIKLKTVRSVTTVVALLLVGIIVGVAIIYAFRKGTPLSVTSQHIILCVIGYHLLMAEAILSLASNTWLPNLSLKHRRLVHWLMQVAGSTLALAGGILKSTSKTTNWDTLHGQFGLVSMIFTAASLINGATSLYAYELRRYLPGYISKLTHVCFGIVAFTAACVCLAYGFHKNGFRSWSTTHVADTLIIMTGGLTITVLVNPLITFYGKLFSVVKY